MVGGKPQKGHFVAGHLFKMRSLKELGTECKMVSPELSKRSSSHRRKNIYWAPDFLHSVQSKYIDKCTGDSM